MYITYSQSTCHFQTIVHAILTVGKEGGGAGQRQIKKGQPSSPGLIVIDLETCEGEDIVER